MEQPKEAANAESLLSLRLMRIELQEELGKFIDARIEKERQQLKLLWSVGSRIAVLASAIVLAALAIIGYQGWKDVSARVDKLAEDRLEKHLSASPPAKYEADIERIYDNVVVSAHLDRAPRLEVPSGPFSSWRNVSTEERDIDRLLRLLTAEATADERCYEISRVLGTVELYRPIIGRIDSAISGLLARDPLPNWLLARPKRLACLIEALSRVEAQGSLSRVRDLLSKNPIDREVRLAALDYIRSTGNAEDAVHISSLIEMPSLDAQTRLSALRTLAALVPTAPAIGGLVDRLTTAKSLNPMEAAEALLIAAELSRGRWRTPTSLSDATLQATSVRLLRAVARASMSLRYDPSGVFIRAPSTRGNEVSIDFDQSLSPGLSRAALATVTELWSTDKLDELAGLVRLLTITNDDDDSAPRGVIKVHVPEVSLAGDQSKSPLPVPADGYYLVAADDGVNLRWLDPAGNIRTLRAVEIARPRVRSASIDIAPIWLRYNSSHFVARSQRTHHFTVAR